MRLFIDDERHPPSRKWEVARSSKAVEWYLDNIGTPMYISFDHDLGGSDTGMIVAKNMIERSLNGLLDFGVVKQINIHSANGPGSENIRGLFSSYFRHLVAESIIAESPLIT